MSRVVRIRRIPSRVPIFGLYEIEVADDRRITRRPMSVLEPLLGVADAWSFLDETERCWKLGSRDWAVDVDIAPNAPGSRDSAAR
jgi:hypothetical protein